jgi:hypothetical protein
MGAQMDEIRLIRRLSILVAVIVLVSILVFALTKKNKKTFKKQNT